MTDIDITPEIVDSVADWVFETGIDASVVHVLREAAAVMRHEQAEEKRIDELAAEAFRAAGASIGSTTCWNFVGETVKDVYRVVVRAVLAKLEQDDLITDPLEAAEHQEKVLGITQEQCMAKARAQGIIPPRRWGDLDDIPGEVVSVYNAYGDLLCRIDGRWLNTEWNSRTAGCGAAPFTESPGSIAKSSPS